MNHTDIIGKKFGLLVVEKFLRKEKYCKRYNYWYTCSCSCGKEIDLPRVNLISYHTNSCGCIKRRKGNNNPCWAGHGEISGRFWSQIKNHAKNRKLIFKISIKDAWEQFLKQNRCCALTGKILNFNTFKPNYSRKTASLDRIDNSKGYVKRNTQWVHKDINWMKGRFSLNRFKELCEMVTKHAS